MKSPLRPKCDGVLPSRLPASDSWRKVKLEFVEAYFRINRAYAKLLAIRQQNAGNSPLLSERRALQEIEKALLAITALEDEYAPYGVDASPVLKNGITINLRFSSPGAVVDRISPPRSSSSIFISLPPLFPIAAD